MLSPRLFMCVLLWLVLLRTCCWLCDLQQTTFSDTDVQFGSNVVLPWQVNTNWLSDSTVCGWYRITCDSSGLVGKIELYQNVLTGSLPEELTLLKESLYYLDLYLNLIHNEGDTGNGWLGKLTNLKNLYYGSNYFQYDGIPPQISNLPLLESYDCSYNLYFGNLTEKIFANLPKLFYLSMGGNQYSSSIPASIYSLPSLERLYIESSDLTGNLEFLQNMPTICECLITLDYSYFCLTLIPMFSFAVEFWMDDNPNITGTIPTTIGLVTTLASLSLTKLSLKGPLPSELGKLSGMVQMWLYDNALTGTIPSEIGNLAAMFFFEVNSTSIQGTMPSEICALTSNLLISLAADCKSEVNCTCCTECYWRQLIWDCILMGLQKCVKYIHDFLQEQHILHLTTTSKLIAMLFLVMNMFNEDCQYLVWILSRSDK